MTTSGHTMQVLLKWSRERIGHRVILEARRRGVILRPLGNVIVLMPPLSIVPEELDHLTSVVRDAIEAATAGSAS